MHRKELTFPPKKFYASPEAFWAAVKFKSELDNDEREKEKGIRIEGGPIGAHNSRFVSLVGHAFRGSQMFVSKEVSDDLNASDLAIEDLAESELEWPMRSLELIFEDPGIPSCIAQQDTLQDLMQQVFTDMGSPYDRKGLGPEPEAVIIRVMLEGEDSKHCSIEFREPQQIIDFVNGNDEWASPALWYAEDTEALQQMAVLVLKVLLFASSEGFAPRPTQTKPSKKQGGKPGFKNRPKTPRLIVEYLPRQIVEMRKEAAEASRKHNFRGRRGHFRTYRAERYKAARGKRQFIAPVPGPDGTIPKRKFVVCKPK